MEPTSVEQQEEEPIINNSLFDVILAIFVALVFVLIMLVIVGVLPLHTDAGEALITIPLSKFAGGSGLLSPGQAVKFSVFVPNKEGTQEAVVDSFGKVSAVLGETPDTVAFALQKQIAPTVQAALLNPTSQIVYNILPDLPTPTTIITPTATITPTNTPTLNLVDLPTPMNNFVFLKIGVNSDANFGGLKQGQFVRLVILPGLEATVAPGTPTTQAPGPVVSCAKIEDFLDDQDQRLDNWDDSVKAVLVQLPIANLTGVVQALENPQKIMLFPDPTCEAN